MRASEIMHRTMRLGIVAVSVGALALVAYLPLQAETGDFHSAANLKCSSCHTIHDSEGGAAVATSGPNAHLLLKKNVTDLCLTCHADPTKGPDVYNASVTTPGGDFAPGGTVTDANGHNPGGVTGNVSTNIGLDATLSLTPPGGTALTEFTCVSCHDPHGETAKAYMFRNLLKTTDGGATGGLAAGDTQEAQIWDGTSANVAAESATNHNVYLTSSIGAAQGFGNWCASCHGNFHGDTVSDTDVGDGTNWKRHPTATNLTSAMVTNYGSTYNPAYPLETTNTGATISATWTVTADGSTEGVTCLSCHRAHASSNANATRWDNTAASGSGTGCNKCHKKGE